MDWCAEVSEQAADSDSASDTAPVATESLNSRLTGHLVAHDRPPGAVASANCIVRDRPQVRVLITGASSNITIKLVA